MTYFLDTNICIHILNNKSRDILKKIRLKPKSSFVISTVTESELWYGVWNSQRKEKNQARLEDFLLCFEKISFTSEHAMTYGQLRSELRQRGKVVGANDLLIASQAFDLEAVVVTASLKEFSQIEGLKVENWL